MARLVAPQLLNFCGMGFIPSMTMACGGGGLVTGAVGGGEGGEVGVLVAAAVGIRDWVGIGVKVAGRVGKGVVVGKAVAVGVALGGKVGMRMVGLGVTPSGAGSAVGNGVVTKASTGSGRR